MMMYPGGGYPGLYWPRVTVVIPPTGPGAPPEIFDYVVYLDRDWAGDVHVDRVVDEDTLYVLSVGEVEATVRVATGVTMATAFHPAQTFNVETER
jgi:hypothetical protein